MDPRTDLPSRRLKDSVDRSSVHSSATLHTHQSTSRSRARMHGRERAESCELLLASWVRGVCAPVHTLHTMYACAHH